MAATDNADQTNADSRRQRRAAVSECEVCRASPAQTRTLGKRTRTLCARHHRRWLLNRGNWLAANAKGLAVKGGLPSAAARIRSPEQARLTGFALAMKRWHPDLVKGRGERQGGGGRSKKT